MKKIMKTKMLILAMMVVCGCSSLVAQTHRVGELITFPDGSLGVVFYVDPLDARRGTAVALSDIDTAYPILSDVMPESLWNMPNASPLMSNTNGAWEEGNGSLVTGILQASGVSPAANAVDFRNGWYIPDALQLRRVFSLLPLLAGVVETAGGDLLSLTKREHWSSTKSGTKMYRMQRDGCLDLLAATNAYYLRPVRDFGAAAVAFWADNPQFDTMLVHPDTTTTFEAILVYERDTFTMPHTLLVTPSFDRDVYRDTTTVSAAPYTFLANPIFNGIDVSTPRDTVLRRTLQTVHGCDSVITLMLSVRGVPRPEDTHYYDTLCPLVEDHPFAPFDTVFRPGTVSGVYVHRGSKVLEGFTMDTVAYYHLTVLPEYEVFDTMRRCLYEPDEVATYIANEHLVFTADGHSVVVMTTGGNFVVVEVSPNRDYMVKMQTKHGCDSLLHLHIAVNKVVRDTVFYEIPITEVTDGRVTAACLTFVGVDAPGSYTLSDTLAVADCDSIVTVVLTVSDCAVDFTVSCPPDVFDTLAYGDCAMTVFPEHIGAPTVLCGEEWPFTISNDFPVDSLFPAGDHLITWTVTDGVCGHRVTCGQHLFVAFPQCPDAVDCEGNSYPGVRIGCDCWTQRNLESTKYSDCTDIPGVYEYVSWQHPDTAENVATYGRLYSFEAAVRDSSDNGYGHVQGICPEGWYLPTPEKYAGLDSYGAPALKSPLYWLDGGGDNSTGFSALPAGVYNGEKNRFEGLLTETYFWSVQGVGELTTNASFTMRYLCDSVLEKHTGGGVGYSVRCIKEKE